MVALLEGTTRVKSAMVKAFKAHYASHEKVGEITKNFAKNIERRQGSYTEDPSYVANAEDKGLADKLAAAAKAAGARKVLVNPGFRYGGGSYRSYTVIAYT